MAQSTHQIASYFDRCAHEGRMLELDADESTQLAACLEHWQIRPGLRVLEPGCGAGRFTEPLAEAVGPDGVVVACDLSLAMLARARRRPLRAPVCWALASAGAIPIHSQVFDRVLIINVFPHLEDRRGVLAELRRALVPGGSLWIHHFISRNELNSLHSALDPPVCDHWLPPADEVAILLAEVGFSVRGTCDDASEYWLHAVR